MARRTYKINDNFFETIDTQKKAYWLGFFLADGTMMIQKKCSYVMRVVLSNKDKKHLDRLIRDMESNYPIHQYNNAYSGVAWTSKKMFNDLLNLGLRPRKSYGYRIPKVRQPLLVHFIRGIFDGDGSIYYRKDRFGVRAEICGTPELCSWILDLTKEELNVGGGIHRRSDITHYWILCGGAQVKKFRGSLYTDAEVYLPRKMNSFYELEEHYKGGSLWHGL